MDLKKPIKVPVSAVLLDLAGSLLLALGILELMDVNIAFLGFVADDPRRGWILVVFGAVFITAATMLILGIILSNRKSRNTIDSRQP